MLPAGIILTGGGSKQEGIVELAKSTLRLPAQVGEITHSISGMVDNLNDPMYAASVGLMLWGLEAGNSTSSTKRPSPIQLGSALNKAKGMFKHFLP